jgi:hypothetical protein
VTEEVDAAVPGNDDEEDAAREKEARAQASIKEREREVQRALATSLRDRDKEREYHKRDEAVQVIRTDLTLFRCGVVLGILAYYRRGHGIKHIFL